jgi:ribosomal protein S18 acetylase RimI-like enzyme
MKVTIHTLSRNYLEQYIEQFISLLHRNLTDEYWASEHFLTDLPYKWELSLYALNELNSIAGFLIASRKQNAIHIHKFVVDTSEQSSGLGTSLLTRLLKTTDQDITLNVSLDNPRAIAFYKKNGFVITDQTDTRYTMTLQRSA